MKDGFGYYCRKKIAYKYRAFEDNPHTMALLENGEVFFSSPALFNDLYDTRLPISSINQRKIEITAETIENKRKNDIAVLCLSEVPDSIPMWTYYGDKNAGVCIGLRLDKLSNGYYGLKLKEGEVVIIEDSPKEPIPAYQVHYYREIQPYVSLDSNERNTRAGFEFLFNKPKQLEHEKEIRVIILRELSCIEWSKDDFKGNTYHLDKGVIESIYLGPNFNLSRFHEIKNLIVRPDTACSRAKLYLMVPDKKYYRYEGKEIPFCMLEEFQKYLNEYINFH